jgi:hypothetical protein
LLFHLYVSAPSIPLYNAKRFVMFAMFKAIPP